MNYYGYFVRSHDIYNQLVFKMDDVMDLTEIVLLSW